MIRTNLYIWNVFLALTRCQDVCLCGLSQLSLICICLSALFSSLTVGAWNTASVVYRMWADDPLCLRSSSQRHPSHYVNYVLNEQFQYESVPNHKWMYRKMINPHFSMRVALGVRIMSSLWNRIDSFHLMLNYFFTLQCNSIMLRYLTWQSKYLKLNFSPRPVHLLFTHES